MKSKKKENSRLKSPVPLWVVLLMVILVTIPGVYAVLTVQNRTYVSIFGEIVEVTEDLSVTSRGIDISPAPRSAVGTDSGFPVDLLGTGSGGVARTDISKGNYTYSIEVSVATVSANTKYNVTLYKEQGGAWILVDSLYVKQENAPSVGDKATLTWDIGASLSSSVYKVEIETYT